jgi:2-methylisocitrate lyase-like PEP mutase family enzyme
MNMQSTARKSFRQVLAQREIMPFIGVHDAFSAAIAGRYCDSLFISGFGFAASHYGLPDIGFIAWSDLVAYVQRIRTILPNHYLLVDIDDGYVDIEVACHVAVLLERMGADAVILEDQKRPRRCGHVDGKQLLDLESYLEKLERVLATRKELFVVARTDSSDIDDIFRRTKAFQAAGADAILVDGLRDFAIIRELKKEIHIPIAFNQIAGGKSPVCSLPELKEIGLSIVNYSTPCLFAAQEAIEKTLHDLQQRNGLIEKNLVGVPECMATMQKSLISRDAQPAMPLPPFVDVQGILAKAQGNPATAPEMAPTAAMPEQSPATSSAATATPAEMAMV